MLSATTILPCTWQLWQACLRFQSSVVSRQVAAEKNGLNAELSYHSNILRMLQGHPENVLMYRVKR